MLAEKFTRIPVEGSIYFPVFICWWQFRQKKLRGRPFNSFILLLKIRLVTVLRQSWFDSLSGGQSCCPLLFLNLLGVLMRVSSWELSTQICPNEMFFVGFGNENVAVVTVLVYLFHEFFFFFFWFLSLTGGREDPFRSLDNVGLELLVLLHPGPRMNPAMICPDSCGLYMSKLAKIR